MDAQKLEKILFEELDYADSPGLLHGTNIPWPGGRDIPNISSALFLENTPIAYFSRLSEIEPEKIKKLHKNVWSQSKAPLLFVTLPHEIRVYNGYEPTPRPNEELNVEPRLLQNLTELTDYLTAQQEIRTKLLKNNYERIYLETGAFWDTTEGKKVNYKNRADQQLVESMKQMRVLLKEKGLSDHLAYTLLGRSIFIRYLEDRGVLTNDWIGHLTDGKVSSYLDALNSRQFTYLLFEKLSERFNGDLFPIDEDAEKYVNEEHLELLLSFLNQTNLETGQLSLWPYNFEYIPIELISNIYDIFLDNRRKSGSYYTPLLLADFILEETMGNDVIRPDMTVLDPACGSGIFLLGAYRRLIQAWSQKNGEPSAEVLNHILQNSIFGADKNSEAVRIATFSLYLEILNHLSNEQIREVSFQFPFLEKNLLDCDFFDEKVDKHFADKKFDRVIGNMPWGRSTLTEKAEKWVKENDYTVGGKQAAPAFMLRAPQFCKDDGEIALLASAKSTILVTSQKHQTFRRQFFTNYHVRAIVNFSALVYELFPKSISPAVAMFYTPNPPSQNSKLVYGVPKPSFLSQYLKAIVLDTTEIRFLDRGELLTYPYLWKVALWGNPRDAALIERLKSIPTLSKQAEKLNWIIGKGIQIEGSNKKIAPWLENMSLVPTKKLSPYFIDMSVCELIKEKTFSRRREQDLVKAPLALIRRNMCYATFSDEDVAYKDAITGIAVREEQEWLLKWLVAYINSSLTKYYHFLTSVSWAVERKVIAQGEYKEMPFLIPDNDDERLKKVLHHLDQIEALLNSDKLKYKEKIQEHKKAIDELVFEIYGLHPVEQQLVKDTLEYGTEFFNWSKRKNRKPRGAKPVQPPGRTMLEKYANVFTRTATSLLRIKNQTLNATVFENGAPLTVVSFDLVSLDEAQPIRVIEESNAMRARLRELEKLILDRKTPSIYMRRHVRVYDGNQLSLARPSEQRFWTQSQARADADAFLAELFS